MLGCERYAPIVSSWRVQLQQPAAAPLGRKGELQENFKKLLRFRQLVGRLLVLFQPSRMARAQPSASSQSGGRPRWSGLDMLPSVDPGMTLA